MNVIEFSWLRRVQGGVTYTIERSSDMATWETVDVPFEDIRVAPGWEYCTATLPLDSSRNLLRVRVSLNP